MAKKKSAKKSAHRFRVVYPLVLVLSIVAAVFAVSRGQTLVDRTQRKLKAARSEVETRKEENRVLTVKIDKLQNPERNVDFIEKIARDTLNFARPGETVYEFQDPAKQE